MAGVARRSRVAAPRAPFSGKKKTTADVCELIYTYVHIGLAMRKHARTP